MQDQVNTITELDAAAKQRVLEWISNDVDPEIRHEVVELIEHNRTGLIDAFYTTLSFGTGGLRGIMGPGSNRMNEYTVSAATQGLANYIIKTLPKNLWFVAIGYDSRHFSKAFADKAAQVLAANGIGVFIFEALRPTPLVSFACRYKKCGAAIMVTASHNPPNYNGYKVYWSDGAQVLPPHDKGIIAEVNAISSRSQIKTAVTNKSLIVSIGEEVDEAYLKAISPLQISTPIDIKKTVKILYSNLHGTGITMVPRALMSFGFDSISYVEKQKLPDGDFPTVTYPNPEDKAALRLGIEQLEREKQDIFLTTDPDCDRIGTVVRHQEKAVCLTGNEVACILCDFVLKTCKDRTQIACVKSIVTSDLFSAICNSYQAACFNVLTGFKYIAQKIREWEESKEYQFLFGAEESYGYLIGTEVRDKDAVVISCLLAEVAAYAKSKSLTLVDYLHNLYTQHGVFREQLFTLSFDEGKAGKDKQMRVLNILREHPPTLLAGSTVKWYSDYKVQEKRNLSSGVVEKISLPTADVLLFELEDRSKIFIRPSGTESKIKVYLMTYMPYKDEHLPDLINACDEKLKNLRKAISQILE